jgi:hypothetical protein
MINWLYRKRYAINRNKLKFGKGNHRIDNTEGLSPKNLSNPTKASITLIKSR